MVSLVRDDDLLITGFDFDEKSILVHLNDGRVISAPLAWYPTLLKATDAQRRHWELLGGGEGAHWPEIDEDLSLKGFLLGNPAAGSEEYWRHHRPKSAYVAIDLDILAELDTEERINAALRQFLHRGAAG